MKKKKPDVVDTNKVIGEIGQLKGSLSSRRQFCGIGLVTPFFGLNGPRNIRRKHKDTKIYHGPLRVPDEVMKMVYENPVVKTTHRKLAVKVIHNNMTYLFRVVGSKDYLGEIVKTENDEYRVHVWSIVPGPMPEVIDIINRKKLESPS